MAPGATTRQCTVCYKEIGSASKSCKHCGITVKQKKSLEHQKLKFNYQWAAKLKEDGNICKIMNSVDLIKGQHRSTKVLVKSAYIQSHPSVPVMQRLYEAVTRGNNPTSVSNTSVSSDPASVRNTSASASSDPASVFKSSTFSASDPPSVSNDPASASISSTTAANHPASVSSNSAFQTSGTASLSNDPTPAFNDHTSVPNDSTFTVNISNVFYKPIKRKGRQIHNECSHNSQDVYHGEVVRERDWSE